MVYKYISSVDFKKCVIGKVEKHGKSPAGEWKIFGVKTKAGESFDFTMRVVSEGIFVKDVEGKGKKFKVFSLPVIIEERSFFDEGLEVLTKKLGRMKASDANVKAGNGETVWLKIPSRNDRILASISMDGKVVTKGGYDCLDEPIEGKIVCRLTGILVGEDGGSAMAQFTLMAADFNLTKFPSFVEIEDDEGEDEVGREKSVHFDLD